MATIAQLQAYARAVALQYGVNPSVFLRQISQESGWNTRARSSAGAEGIAQFMPGTAASHHVNPWDPRAALRAAALMDSQALHAYHGSYQKMLAAYNAGPGAVSGGYWQSIPQTRDYVASILNGVGNPHVFARSSVAAGTGGGGSVGGGGAAANGAALAAMLQRPISVPMAPAMPTAATALQNMLANRAATQSVPMQTPFMQSTAPTSTDLVGSLDSLHSSLLGRMR